MGRDDHQADDGTQELARAPVAAARAGGRPRRGPGRGIRALAGSLLALVLPTG